MEFDWDKKLVPSNAIPGTFSIDGKMQCTASINVQDVLINNEEW